MKLVVIGIGKSHCNDNISPLKCVNEKKLEAKPLFCTKICTFAIFMVFKSWRSITQNANFQITWNSKLMLPRYIREHPWKKIGGQTPFCTKICTFAIFMIFKSWRSITQNAHLQMTWNSKLKLPRNIREHPWKKKLETKPLFCTKICTFAIFMVFKIWRAPMKIGGQGLIKYNRIGIAEAV